MSEQKKKAGSRLVYYDLETTGLGFHNKHKDIEIVEIGAVDGETRETFRQYILPPGNHIPRDASNVHGIYLRDGVLYRDDEELEAVDLKTGLQNFLGWLKGFNQPITLAGYNSHNFDDWVICHNLLREGLRVAGDGGGAGDKCRLVTQFLDVSKIVRPYIRATLGVRKWSLTFAVKSCLDRGQSDAHSAVSDAVDTLDLMVKVGGEKAPEQAYKDALYMETMCDRLAKGLPMEEEIKTTKIKSNKKTVDSSEEVDKKQPKIGSFFKVILSQRKEEIRPDIITVCTHDEIDKNVNKENVKRKLRNKENIVAKMQPKQSVKRKVSVLEEVDANSSVESTNRRSKRIKVDINTEAEILENNVRKITRGTRGPRKPRAPRERRGLRAFSKLRHSDSELKPFSKHRYDW